MVAAAESSDHVNGSGPHLLYPIEMPIRDKIGHIACTMYGADGVEFRPEASRQIKPYTDLGWDRLPICIAKTQYSLSDNAAQKNRPSDFTVMIREVRAYTGAGLLCPIAGEIMTMPGLPSNGANLHIGLDDDGQIVGLF